MGNMIDGDNIEQLDVQLSKKEIDELEVARSMPITFDEDCPETTPERALKFKHINSRRKKEAEG